MKSLPGHGFLYLIQAGIMANSLYETCLQGIMVVVFIKANTQSKLINTTYQDSLQALLIGGIGHLHVPFNFFVYHLD